jgi:hypothetical protein
MRNMPTPASPELPDFFRFRDGARVRARADWGRRRAEILAEVLGIEYGPLPPPPSASRSEKLHEHRVPRFGDARHAQYRLAVEGEFSANFVLDLMIPAGEGPFPVVLDGDGCWKYVSDEVTAEVLRRGWMLAVFNRCELRPDPSPAGGPCASLATWAWGYHRCVDFLATLSRADAGKIAATGHSRGGKVALLAGATDARIALTAPNNSGCGGAGCLRWPGEKSERLADILKGFPEWFSPRLKEFIGREAEMPFDQHAVKALVAPRALLCTEARGDLWANPVGTWQSQRAAAEAWRFLGAGEQLGAWYREGAHAHVFEDWKTLLDFADWRLRGLPPARDFAADPFPGLPPAHAWSAPE